MVPASGWSSRWCCARPGAALPEGVALARAVVLADAGRLRAMIPVLTGVQVGLATGHTDMRKGFDGLALLVQETLERDPHNGHLFVSAVVVAG